MSFYEISGFVHFKEIMLEFLNIHLPLKPHTHTFIEIMSINQMKRGLKNIQYEGIIDEVNDYSSNAENFAVARFRTYINSITLFTRGVFLFLFSWSIQAI